VRRLAPGSAHRTAARIALAAGVLALAVCAWEVTAARSGAADAQVAGTAAQNDAAVAQAITSLQLAELNNVIEPTATSQKQLVAQAARTRALVSALAARVDADSPPIAARLRIEAQVLDSEIRKLVAATASSNGQAVMDVNARVQQLASSMRTEVSRQQQVDAGAAHSNLQSLRSSRPVMAGLVVALLALAAAALLTFGPGRGSGRTSTVRRRGDQTAPRGGPSPS
jgi:NADH dehydrogenase/NADH:ubiquinone oxidoreductase subunit G